VKALALAPSMGFSAVVMSFLALPLLSITATYCERHTRVSEVQTSNRTRDSESVCGTDLGQLLGGSRRSAAVLREPRDHVWIQHLGRDRQRVGHVAREREREREREIEGSPTSTTVKNFCD